MSVHNTQVGVIELTISPFAEGQAKNNSVEGTVPYRICATEGKEKNINAFKALCLAGKKKEQDKLYDVAIEQYLNALKINEIPYGLVAFAYCSLGRSYSSTRRHAKALEFFKCYLKIAQQIVDRNMECAALSNLGVTYYNLMVYDEAIKIHTQCLELSQRYPEDVTMQMMCFANLGNCFGSMGKFRNAVTFHEQQLRLAKLLNDHKAETRAAFNLENDHNSLNQYEIALGYKDKKVSQGEDDTKTVKLNHGFGDNDGKETFSGWLVKHQGGGVLGPDKIGSAKRWCILRGNIFEYHRTAKSADRALRYLRLSDVVAIELYEKTEGKVVPSHGRSFRLVTDSRAFYFTADNTEECGQWIDVLNQARTTRDQFGTFKKHRIGKTSFLQQYVQEQEKAEEAANSAKDAFAHDPLHHEKEMENPLFRMQSTSASEMSGTVIDGEDDPNEVS